MDNLFKYQRSNLDILAPCVETSLMTHKRRVGMYMHGSISYFLIDEFLIIQLLLEDDRGKIVTIVNPKLVLFSIKQTAQVSTVTHMGLLFC